jgi:serine/threonine-protein kinase
MTSRRVRDRFLREARTAAGLSHPNIVAIHRVAEAGGLPFFVMTFVKGETLGERLRSRGPVTPAVMTLILRDVAQALAYAHGHGTIHRDIKPDNILLEEDSGRALVTDFGNACVADDSVPAEGTMGSTAAVHDPEQVMGEPLDGRSDLYALGVVAHLALSGKLPIDAPSISELMVKRVSEAAPPIGSVASGVPGSLARVV